MTSQPAPLSKLLAAALVHQRAGRSGEAVRICEMVLSQAPGQVDALHLLGVFATGAGESERGIEFIAKAVAGRPGSGAFRVSLATALKLAGRMDEAVAELREAIRLDAKSADAHNNLGNILASQQKVDEAIGEYRIAIELQPDFVLAWANLGSALRDKGLLKESIEAQRRALRLKPDFAEVHGNLAIALKQDGQIEEAIAASREAIRLRPGYVPAHSNLGDVLMKVGRIEEAIACFRKAVELSPGDVVMGSNLVFAMLFDPRSTAEGILEEHRKWAGSVRLARKVVAQSPSTEDPHPNPPPEYRGRGKEGRRDPERALRVGWVSPNFWDHVIARNIRPIFEHRTKGRFESFCYHTGTRKDEFTVGFEAFCDGWRETAGMSDEAVARMIGEDRIDILVDLSLHLPGGELKIFSRKPAAVQVAFAGYPGTTGLAEMDWRMTDPFLDPPRKPPPLPSPGLPGEGVGGDAAWYSEKSYRLPHSFWCYDPKAMEPANGLEVAALPAIARGCVTFGSLTSSFKVNGFTIDLWSKVLREVPGSRMIILADPRYFRRVAAERFAANGIDVGRIEFVDRQKRMEYLHTFDRIDLGLDTFPYNGHTTSLDSLWMGVPVVTMVGKTVVGRAGWSQLNNLGLTQFAALTADDLVKLAVKWAGDLAALAEVRGSMRKRMLESPLTDGKGFAAAIESAWREMWREWCGR